MNLKLNKRFILSLITLILFVLLLLNWGDFYKGFIDGWNSVK